MAAVADIDEQVQLRDPHSSLHKARLAQVLTETETWLGNARTAWHAEGPVPTMPTYPAELLPPDNHQQPTVLYNAMIHPIVPYAMRHLVPGRVQPW